MGLMIVENITQTRQAFWQESTISTARYLFKSLGEIFGFPGDYRIQHFFHVRLSLVSAGRKNSAEVVLAPLRHIL